MAEKAKNPFEAFAGFDWTKDFAGLWTQGLPKGMPSGSAEMLDRIRTFSKETAGFFEDRLRKDMEAAKALTEAKNPADVARIQMEYMQTLVTDYNRQAMKVAEETGKSMTAMFGKWPGMST